MMSFWLKKHFQTQKQHIAMNVLCSYDGTHTFKPADMTVCWQCTWENILRMIVVQALIPYIQWCCIYYQLPPGYVDDDVCLCVCVWLCSRINFVNLRSDSMLFIHWFDGEMVRIQTKMILVVHVFKRTPIIRFSLDMRFVVSFSFTHYLSHSTRERFESK